MTSVGILGGGQLARMLALAGAPLGLRFLVLDSAADACAAQCAPMLRADYHDFEALADFAARVDVATFDFENVPADSAHWLAERVPVFPNPRALAVAQDRLAEKTLFRELGIAVPPFVDVKTRDELDAAIDRIGAQCILKRDGWVTTARDSFDWATRRMPMPRGLRSARRRRRSD
jgi:5-(carboxyamino)imidazole ribonucleotide synthase